MCQENQRRDSLLIVSSNSGGSFLTRPIFPTSITGIPFEARPIGGELLMARGTHGELVEQSWFFSGPAFGSITVFESIRESKDLELLSINDDVIALSREVNYLFEK